MFVLLLVRILLQYEYSILCPSLAYSNWPWGPLESLSQLPRPALEAPGLHDIEFDTNLNTLSMHSNPNSRGQQLLGHICPTMSGPGPRGLHRGSRTY